MPGDRNIPRGATDKTSTGRATDKTSTGSGMPPWLRPEGKQEPLQEYAGNPVYAERSKNIRRNYVENEKIKVDREKSSPSYSKYVISYRTLLQNEMHGATDEKERRFYAQKLIELRNDRAYKQWENGK